MTIGAYNILESAVANIGYWHTDWDLPETASSSHWSGWASELPDAFEIEFSGVRLWVPPLEKGQPPSGQIALRFCSPSCVVFLVRDHPARFRLSDEWHHEFQAGDIGTFLVDDEGFTLTRPRRANVIRDSAISEVIYHGLLRNVPDGSAHGSFCALGAGPVGLHVIAESVTIWCHRGEVELWKMRSMADKWWEYWRRYWERRSTDHPLPKDRVCENTIPAEIE